MKTMIIEAKKQRDGYEQMIANAREIPTTFFYVSWVSSWELGGGGVVWMASSNVVAHAGWDRCEVLEYSEYIPCLVTQVVVMYLAV